MLFWENAVHTHCDLTEISIIARIIEFHGHVCHAIKQHQPFMHGVNKF